MRPREELFGRSPITPGQARLTLEFLRDGLLEKKLQLISTSILLIVLSPGPGCYSRGGSSSGDWPRESPREPPMCSTWRSCSSQRQGCFSWRSPAGYPSSCQRSGNSWDPLWCGCRSGCTAIAFKARALSLGTWFSKYSSAERSRGPDLRLHWCCRGYRSDHPCRRCCKQCFLRTIDYI